MSYLQGPGPPSEGAHPAGVSLLSCSGGTAHSAPPNAHLTWPDPPEKSPSPSTLEQVPAASPGHHCSWEGKELLPHHQSPRHLHLLRVPDIWEVPPPSQPLSALPGGAVPAAQGAGAPSPLSVPRDICFFSQQGTESEPGAPSLSPPQGSSSCPNQLPLALGSALDLPR